MADTLEAPQEKEELSDNDWSQVEHFIADETRRRAKHPRRANLEKEWKEIDRQIRMEPVRRVDARTGKPIAGTEWMPELEAPLQAQALEVLCADARRLIFPDDRNFFSAHAALDDDLLQRVEQGGIVFGDKAGVPFKADQEGMDSLLEGAMMHFHSLWDFRQAVDLLNAEAFKYGTFVARGRLMTLDKFTTDFRGRSVRRQRIPVLAPQSIKHTYPDDTVQAIMHEGMMVAPSFIYSWWHTVDDLRLAADKGSKDAENENGGWMPDRLVGVEPVAKDKKSIQVVEYEGDLIVPRSSGTPSIFLPNVIVSVVFGRGGPRVFRYREREFDYRSYIVGPYHREDVESPYGTSPLLKGSPIHKAATEAFNRMMQAAILSTEPPISWNPNDPYLLGRGGPVIAPGEVWDALTKPEIVEIGNPDALLNVYLAMIRWYEDVTGVSSPRLGAQTKSHQTAFAIDTEQSRGQIRTVDYVQSLLFGALSTWLHMEHDMLRRSMKKQAVYIPKLQGWAELGKDSLPDMATFDVHGAAGPQEEREKALRAQSAIVSVLQIEEMKVQLGSGRPLDLDKLQKRLLFDGGIVNAEDLYAAAGDAGMAGASAPQSNLQAVASLVSDQTSAA